MLIIFSFSSACWALCSLGILASTSGGLRFSFLWTFLRFTNELFNCLLLAIQDVLLFFYQPQSLVQIFLNDVTGFLELGCIYRWCWLCEDILLSLAVRLRSRSCGDWCGFWLFRFDDAVSMNAARAPMLQPSYHKSSVSSTGRDLARRKGEEMPWSFADKLHDNGEVGYAKNNGSADFSLSHRNITKHRRKSWDPEDRTCIFSRRQASLPIDWFPLQLERTISSDPWVDRSSNLKAMIPNWASFLL